MKAALAALLLCAIAAVASAHSKKATPSPGKAPANALESRGKNWKVTIVSAEGYTAHRPNIDPPVSGEGVYNLALEVELQYLGEPGSVAPPALVVSDPKGAKFPTLEAVTGIGQEASYSVIAWLISAGKREPLKRGIRTGQEFKGMLLYVGGIPLATRNVRWSLGDTPPAPLTVTMRK